MNNLKEDLIANRTFVVSQIIDSRDRLVGHSCKTKQKGGEVR